jgi:hypothetical protein
MTRKDWWLGIALIMLALAVGFGVMLRELNDIRSEIRSEAAPRVRPLARF